MKLLPIVAAAASICAASPAFSAFTTLNFEDQTSFTSVSYAPNVYGISANGALLALANDGSGNGSNGEFFSNNPSGTTVMFATTPLVGERAEIASTQGFVGQIDFYYSSTAASTVYVRDQAGLVLNQFSLAANSTSETSPFDTWTFASLAFAGQAYSIDFSDTVGVAAFDNVTVNAVPLPAALLLFPFGAAALGAAGRRKRAA